MRLVVTALAGLFLASCSSETKNETTMTTPDAAAPAATTCDAHQKPAHHAKKKMKKAHKEVKTEAKAEVKTEEHKTEEHKEEKK